MNANAVLQKENRYLIWFENNTKMFKNVVAPNEKLHALYTNTF